VIASLPTEPATDPEHQTIAARLIALLPQRPVAARSPLKAPPRGAAVSTTSAATYALYYVIFMLFILLSQWLIGSRQAPVQGEASTPNMVTAPSPAPPQSSSP